MDVEPFEEWERALFEAVDQRPDASDAEIKDLLQATVNRTAEATLEELRRERPRMLIDHAALRAHFETAIRDPWGSAFDRLETLLVAAGEAVELFLERHRDQSNAIDPDGDPLFYALVRLHTRACRVTSEIFALLRTGHPRGALARWRTLHEIAVTMAFLNQHGRSVAEAYLRHDAVASFRELSAFQRYAQKLGETPFSADEAAGMEAERDELLLQYGSAYGGEYGWACLVLPGDPTFTAIERAANLDHWRPYVKWASQQIHAGPKGVIVERILDDGAELLIAGPQDDDLADPGRNAAVSLALASVELLVSKPTFDGLVQMSVLRSLAADVEEAFLDAHAELERRQPEPDTNESERADRK